jgi:hypothetical protein
VVGSFFRVVRQTIWLDGGRPFDTREYATSVPRQGAGHLCRREGSLASKRRIPQWQLARRREQPGEISSPTPARNSMYQDLRL